MLRGQPPRAWFKGKPRLTGDSWEKMWNKHIHWKRWVDGGGQRSKQTRARGHAEQGRSVCAVVDVPVQLHECRPGQHSSPDCCRASVIAGASLLAHPGFVYRWTQERMGPNHQPS